MTDSAVRQGEEFEFNDSHNMVFDSLARWMKIVGIIEIALGVVYAVPAVAALIVLNTPVVVIAALHIVIVAAMGLWTIKAGGHVRAIVHTEGDDVRHLMEAMDQLKKLFLLQGAVFVIMIVLAVAGFVAGGAAGALKTP